ncbi:MAG: hypothetical protein L6Q99_12435 [Planctomycetes bacterium]|nr:hypothetical protein [Planctomycetota bacterium]
MTANDDELIASVLAGDLDPDSALWKAAVARNPALAKRWEELRTLREALERTGADERDSLARSKADAGPHDVASVRRAAPVVRAGARAGGRRLAYFAAAAAVALIVGFVAYRQFGGSSPEQDVFLGDQSDAALRATEPTLDVGDAHEFAWTGDAPPGGAFVVKVFELDAAGAPGRCVVESGSCTERTWRPSESELAKIPNEFFWVVESRRDAVTFEDSSAPQRALRSRP